jgi:hypothetical protein
VDEGLSKLLSFLREEEERERLEEVERLKPIGTPVRHPLRGSRSFEVLPRLNLLRFGNILLPYLPL